MGIQKDVKDLIREYGLVVVYVVIGDVFCVYVESFKRAKVWSFLWCLNTCIVLWMVRNEWLCSMRFWANFDVRLLARKARLCSLNLTVNFLSV